MAKHTPGEWLFISRGGWESSYGITAPAPHHWVIPPLNINPDDARLMAASKELLEALQDMVNDIAERFDMDSPSTNPGIKICVENARAAIAKATGQCLKGEE